MHTTLMVQGTTSDAGKSLMVAGLCRLLVKRGISVAPFKPQNMALNSAVTTDGGEIGRAQALQAYAANLDPVTDMNPILIKPESDTRAQVIVHGKALQAMDAQEYQYYKSKALDFVMESYFRLESEYEVVVVEGAGSPAEINLRENDVANMGFAEAADCPVVLVADIDRGGVFATVVGTLDLLSESERDRIVGVIINKFRGDISLLEPGLDWLEQTINKPVLGVLPFLPGLHLDAEDAINATQELSRDSQILKVVVVVFPRISNHTDFDSLRLHSQVELTYISLDDALPACDLVILPGTKNVREDLHKFREAGLDTALKKHLRYGGKLLGVCGGMQMLGDEVRDPLGIEFDAGVSVGLGLLNFTTELEPNKELQQRQGELLLEHGRNIPIAGYEIHCGRTTGDALDNPLISFEGGLVDGAISEDGQIIGSYLHGLLDLPEACAAILRWAGLESDQEVSIEQQRDCQLDRLAKAMESYINVDMLFPQSTSKQADLA